jgi:hypothetical protein
MLACNCPSAGRISIALNRAALGSAEDDVIDAICARASALTAGERGGVGVTRANES